MKLAKANTQSGRSACLRGACPEAAIFTTESGVILSAYDKFHAYLCELLQSYDKLSSLLQEKLTVVQADDTGRLDGIIKEEQVFVLISKGFDASIKKYREELSLQGETLSSIVKELPGEERQRFQDVFRQLQSKLSEVKGLNERCQSLIQEKLYSLDKTIKGLDKSATTTYNKDKSTPAGGGNTHFLTKSV